MTAGFDVPRRREDMHRFAPVTVLHAGSTLPPIQPRDLALTRGRLAMSAVQDAPAPVGVPKPTRQEMRVFRLLITASVAVSLLTLVGLLTVGRFIAAHWLGAERGGFVVLLLGVFLTGCRIGKRHIWQDPR